MTRKEIFEKINAERERQNKIHPENKFPLIDKVNADDLSTLLDYIRVINDTGSNTDGDKVSYYSIIQEEICEAFIAKSREERNEELIHVAAVAVRIIEEVS
jgi:hypothetical protein